ncbi:hypothetical protein PS1_003284 [Malus domestica]
MIDSNLSILLRWIVVGDDDGTEDVEHSGIDKFMNNRLELEIRTHLHRHLHVKRRRMRTGHSMTLAKVSSIRVIMEYIIQYVSHWRSSVGVAAIFLFLLDGGDDTLGGTAGADDVLIGDGEEVVLLTVGTLPSVIFSFPDSLLFGDAETVWGSATVAVAY